MNDIPDLPLVGRAVAFQEVVSRLPNLAGAARSVMYGFHRGVPTVAAFSGHRSGESGSVRMALPLLASRGHT
jgi:hypothetical protein